MQEPSSSPQLSQSLPTSNLAIISLVSGFAGFTVLPLIGCVVAIITGYMAKKEIRESAGTLGGDGMATAGLVMGWVGIGLAIVGMCIAVVVFVVPLCLALFGIAAQGFQSSLAPFLWALL